MALMAPCRWCDNVSGVKREKVVTVLNAEKLGWRVSLPENPKGSELFSAFDNIMLGVLQQEESVMS